LSKNLSPVQLLVTESHCEIEPVSVQGGKGALHKVNVLSAEFCLYPTGKSSSGLEAPAVLHRSAGDHNDTTSRNVGQDMNEGPGRQSVCRKTCCSSICHRKMVITLSACRVQASQDTYRVLMSRNIYSDHQSRDETKARRGIRSIQLPLWKFACMQHDGAHMIPSHDVIREDDVTSPSADA
jgi:hypothetical protein